MSELKLLLIVHAAATLIMTGVILVIQFVHYPLFRLVGTETYTAYQAAHMSAITLVVLPLMGVELITGLLLLGAQPPGVPAWMVYAGFGLIIVVWLMTGLVNAPQHGALSMGFNADTHTALVASNWVRTLAWVARSLLVCAMVWAMIQPQPTA